MRKLTAAVVSIGVTGVSLIGLAGAAGATDLVDTTKVAGVSKIAELSDRPDATRLAALSTIAGGSTTAGAAPGAAAPDALNGVIKLPATSYTSPSNQSLRVHTLEAGTPVQTLCFTEGQTLNNNFYWFRILQGGDLGFVHRDAIAAPGDLRHC